MWLCPEVFEAHITEDVFRKELVLRNGIVYMEIKILRNFWWCSELTIIRLAYFIIKNILAWQFLWVKIIGPSLNTSLETVPLDLIKAASCLVMLCRYQTVKDLFILVSQCWYECEIHNYKSWVVLKTKSANTNTSSKVDNMSHWFFCSKKIEKKLQDSLES